MATGLAAAAAAQQNLQQPALSMSPLSAEQLSVYHDVLVAWMGREMPSVNLAARTQSLDANSMGDAKDCGKGLVLEPSSTLVHEFHTADLLQLGGSAITLIEPAQGEKQVHANDPERTIGSGKSIEDAVQNAFAHGLFTFSEIRFDRTHTHAIVSYSFVCGGLCGHGETLILEKTSTGWRRSGQCSNWIS
jgi:hypothetical protein